MALALHGTLDLILLILALLCFLVATVEGRAQAVGRAGLNWVALGLALVVIALLL